MKKFEDTFDCDCGKSFFWKYMKLDNGDYWSGKMEDRVFNCVNFTETPNIYSIEIRCPNCARRHFVTIQK